MDKLFTIHLELTYKNIDGSLYSTMMYYCSPNQDTSLLNVVVESQFVMAVDKCREKSGFPYSCYLVGVRELPNDIELF